MSNNLSREAVLTAAVLNAPYVFLGEGRFAREQCAFERLDDFEWTSTFETAKKFGFSRHEAMGVMRGWDRAAGNPVFFESAAKHADTIANEPLGARLYELTRGQK